MTLQPFQRTASKRCSLKNSSSKKKQNVWEAAATSAQRGQESAVLPQRGSPGEGETARYHLWVLGAALLWMGERSARVGGREFRQRRR